MSKSAAQVKGGGLNRQVRLVAIPAEHGGWGFVLEPALLGMFVAPSYSGLWLAATALAMFLVRQPMKLALADRLGGKRYPRTILAERFALLFGMVALGTLVPAVLTARAAFWLPVVLAAPFALLQAFHDVRRQGRDTVAELSGAVAMGAAGSAIALAGGFPLDKSLAIWAILAARAVASIIYVRARLRLERRDNIDRRPSWISHVAGLAIAALLALAGIAPWLAALAMLVLAARAIWGLSPLRRPARAPVIGSQEIGYGLMTVLLTAAGYAFHL